MNLEVLLSSLLDQGKFYRTPALFSVLLFFVGKWLMCFLHSFFSPTAWGRGCWNLLSGGDPFGKFPPKPVPNQDTYIAGVCGVVTQSKQWDSLWLLKVVVLPYCPPSTATLQIQVLVWFHTKAVTGSYISTKLIKFSYSYSYFWFIVWNSIVLEIHLKV